MRILVSGASGFIGAPLCAYLKEKSHTLVSLTRKSSSSSDTISWDPQQGKIAKEEIEGFDAVIHLAGEPLTPTRWSRAKRKKILFSRTVGTWFLSQMCAQLLSPPKVFISASAIGYYGDRGEEVLVEESPAGEGFLPDVCVEWEKATQAIEDRGTRTVRARFGMVLGPHGGALQRMLLPYKLGMGGHLGSGNQWISWIARSDLIHGLEHALHTDSLEGAVNFTSPNPVRQKEFSKILAKLLHRPAFLSLPPVLLRLLLGKVADEMLLASTRVEPKKLSDSGFSFQYPFLEEALKAAIDGFKILA